MTLAEFWKNFLKKTNQKEKDMPFNGELCFEDEGWTGSSQLSLVLQNKKTAIFTPYPSFEINREKLPSAGEVYIVEDTAEEPCAVIKIKDVKIIPFNAISWELAQLDGEDQSFDDWKDKMTEFFEEEAALCGFDFNEDMDVVVEIFELIFREK